MMSIARRAAAVAFICLLALTVLPLFAQPAISPTVDPSYYKAMQWRLIGPFRAGRISAVTGVPGSGTTFYVGTPAGGVWKTTDAGQVWTPIFDSQPVSSIGALAVSESNPNIIYAGSGEQNQGDGVYKSADAGKTWTNIGLRNTHVITMLLIDPRNPDIVLVGAAGDRTSAAERGVYKTTDGGKTWNKTLFKDNDTAVMDMNFESGTPKVVYAALQHRSPNSRLVGGGGGGQQPPREQDAFIYKSTDEGSTWKPIGCKGLPTEAMGRTGVAVAPGTKGNTVFVIASQGLFKSTDGGANFVRSTTDPRILGSWYFSRVFVDPKNANIVYVAQTTMYRSTDGGKTFDGWYGAPSGDDIHMIWIDPANTKNLLLGVDQGAIVSLNSGTTWSSWYNQPTGQFYHVSTDNRFPYYVYGAQQDSGTAAVASRSDFGLITYRDWAPTGGFEFAYIAPDPLNPNLVYTGGWYGSILRYDKVTGQITHLFVRTPKYRTSNMAPIVFSPQDPHLLYIAAQYVLKTSDAGMTWQEVSPDLTKKPAAKSEPPEPGSPGGPVISTLALSTVKAGVMWAGTSNGLVQVSKDGTTWQNVTPPGLPEHATINAVEASRHDAAEAYVVVNVRQDLDPYVFRTRDFGQTWQPVITGMPKGAIARIVREDPVRKGLLYGGTENAAYVSFDDGDHWQSLQLNLPVTPVRDLEVHGNDLVAATYGRALWILDDISPLRQFDETLRQADAALLKPADAVRARWDVNGDTPLQPETPAGKNPPEGAIFDYYLKSAPAGEVTLSVFDSHNRLVRKYSSVAPKVDKTPPNVPYFWFAPPATLSKTPGHNRFAWDFRYPSPMTLRYGYYGNLLDYVEYTLADHAIPGETPREQPLGPIAVAGEYTVALTVNGHTYKQPLSITPDPRVKASQADLVAQLTTETNISAMMAITSDGYMQLSDLRKAIAERQKALASGAQAKDALDALMALDEQTVKIANGSRSDLGIGPINRELARLLTMVSSGDSRPATPLKDGTATMCRELTQRLAQWRDLNEKSIPQVNTLLEKYSQTPVPGASPVPSSPECK